MYKDYNMTKRTLLMEISVLIPQMILQKQFPILNSMNSDIIVA
ncbi:hypothetical protein [Staphylococcus epidermidis]|nr:hypothetical protein [Staphylococcus epidermidis]